jgi:4-alpha-glucanotransferase
MTPAPQRWRRAGGVLLHPTSAPGPFGMGDLGPSAERWLDWLSSSACRLWQVLPLGPVGPDASPYLSSSAFAGNALLISPEKLAEDGLLIEAELTPFRAPVGNTADFGHARMARSALVSLATQRLLAGAAPHLADEVQTFFDSNAYWLDDFALFRSLSAEYGAAWLDWPSTLAGHDLAALEAFAQVRRPAIQAAKIEQYFFERQWSQVRAQAHASGIDIIGDIPIFVAHESADVWAHPELFKLDDHGRPTVVAGVPPDYFSATGQRWGNPHYDWKVMESRGFRWWTLRLRRLLSQVDRVRVDHFRGFEAAWEIPASSPTAQGGRWVQGPGEAVFREAEAELGRLPIIAEDLGLITPAVTELRDRLGFPGMRVLQFAFDGNPDHPYLPHRYPTNCVAYTGTHDNDTSRGWYEAAPEAVRDACRRYVTSVGSHVAWDMTRAVWASAADTTVVPLQDLLELGTEARMNTPGTTEGNWLWRVTDRQLSTELADRLRGLSLAYER